MDGHGTSPEGRCEGIPDPSEVSSLGKLRRNFVFEITNWNIRDIINHGFEMLRNFATFALCHAIYCVRGNR